MSRPRGNDEQHVIDRATELLDQGYEATSVTDLTAELGVHPGSLYRTFGDERTLFLRTLSVLSDVEDGCLQGRHAAARQGEIAPILDLPGWAAALRMLVQGHQVVVKADPDSRPLVQSVDAILCALPAVGR